jgi:MFS transporter, OPA family, glycerol-3-phosphate transporter
MGSRNVNRVAHGRARFRLARGPCMVALLMGSDLLHKLTLELRGILLLLGVIALVLWRLPKVEIDHSPEFRRRRFWNWFPLGLTYALLYFGRYNLSANVAALDKLGIMSKQEFGGVDFWGSLTYGFAFLLNGPLTDRWGGRTTILLASAGSAVMNLAMAAAFSRARGGGMTHDGFISAITVLNAANMYFQSFGAVSIVKVNAPWFHVRERGVLGGVFGILISIGLYLAYDGSRLLAGEDGSQMMRAFVVPAAVLLLFCAIDFFVIRDTPGDAGFADFDTADASSGDTTERPRLADVARKMFSQRVIWIIVAIEFCSGFLRNAVMKWFLPFAKDTNLTDTFVYRHWGALLCASGILGGVFAGFISDHVFKSRRGPVASVLYGGMLIGIAAALGLLGTPMIGWAFMFASLCVIGVHGMLSGTASADFGGKKNAGIATGIIDGFVYLGTAVQSALYGGIGPDGARLLDGLLPKKEAAKDPANWRMWPIAMLPVALIGLVLATRVWNAKPKALPALPPAPPPEPLDPAYAAPGQVAAAVQEEDPALAATVAAAEAPEKK